MNPLTNGAVLCVPSEEPRDDFLAVFDSSSDGRRKLASLSKASPDRTTWNILVLDPLELPLSLHITTWLRR